MEVNPVSGQRLLVLVPNASLRQGPLGKSGKVRFDQIDPDTCVAEGSSGGGDLPTYKVKQGDCISSIAHQTGFYWETLWNDPRNTGLRERRSNPNALLPGDVVFIPDKRDKEEPCETARVHQFRLKGDPVRFNLRVLDGFGKPRSEIPYTLAIGGSSRRGKTDSTGRISEVIEPDAGQAKLTLNPPSQWAEVYEFKLGHMNPVDNIAGWQARLRNLGYLKEVTRKMDEAAADGLQEFQYASKLKETGEPDGATQSALTDKYGG
jgi:N-acetylmuramoyl-L-alanine amidase